MRYQNVQVLRAVAASVVVVGHAAGNGLIAVPNAVATLGYSGVDIFFVLSGFIICQVAKRTEENAIRFLWRRYWRIFPLYWIVLAFSLGINYMGVQTAAPWMGWRPAIEYVFLLTTENRFVPQAWTLVFELYFYTVVAVILVVAPRRYFYRLVAAWLGLQTTSTLVFGPAGGPLSNLLVLEFGLGCFVAWLTDREIVNHRAPALLAGFSLFAAGDAWLLYTAPVVDPMTKLLTFGVGSTLCLYAAVSSEGQNSSAPPSLLLVGDASYSLYLWHLPLILVAVPFGIGGFSLLIIYAASFASYHFIETPLLRSNFASRATASRQVANLWNQVLARMPEVPRGTRRHSRRVGGYAGPLI